MNYIFYKLEFSTGVHFGKGMLNDTQYTFGADTLFSALYIEALKMGKAEELFDLVSNRKLCLSDAFPYKGEQYMLPKPVLYVEAQHKGDSVEKKKYKHLKYIPVEQFTAYLKGKMTLEKDPLEHFGHYEQQTMAAVRREGDTLPFHVGTWYFEKENGLYLIAGYENEKAKELLDELLEAVSYVGIGGKRGSGLGKFALKYGKANELLKKRLDIEIKEGQTSMLLSRALPKEEELENALTGASYLLEKRSGFVASSQYAKEERRKKDLYVFASGSCFQKSFKGNVYDVSDGGLHPVYLYAMPLFMEVRVGE